MQKIFYRKLIRDNIPDIIEAKGAPFKIRKLSVAEFKIELLKKVGEEASPLPSIKKRAELVSELADVAEVIAEIQRVFKISEAELKKKRREHVARKGGFAKKLFLEWSGDDGYKTNERTEA